MHHLCTKFFFLLPSLRLEQVQEREREVGWTLIMLTVIVILKGLRLKVAQGSKRGHQETFSLCQSNHLF